MAARPVDIFHKPCRDEEYRYYKGCIPEIMSEGYSLPSGNFIARFDLEGQLDRFEITGAVEKVVLSLEDQQLQITNSAAALPFVGTIPKWVQWSRFEVVFALKSKTTVVVRFFEPTPCAALPSLRSRILKNLPDDMVWKCAGGDVTINRALCAAATGMLKKMPAELDLRTFNVEAAQAVKRIFVEGVIRPEDVEDADVVVLLYHLCFEEHDRLWQVLNKTLTISNVPARLGLAAHFKQNIAPSLDFFCKHIEEIIVENGVDAVLLAKAVGYEVKEGQSQTVRA